MQPDIRAFFKREDLMNTDKRLLPAFLLCLFLGGLGFHRFYVGKIGTGILMLLTLGGLGIWSLVDLIILVCGNFKDKEGNKITQWT
jgi:TM2 domain-containing membrane protein YozV